MRANMPAQPGSSSRGGAQGGLPIGGIDVIAREAREHQRGSIGAFADDAVRGAAGARSPARDATTLERREEGEKAMLTPRRAPGRGATIEKRGGELRERLTDAGPWVEAGRRGDAHRRGVVMFGGEPRSLEGQPCLDARLDARPLKRIGSAGKQRQQHRFATRAEAPRQGGQVGSRSFEHVTQRREVERAGAQLLLEEPLGGVAVKASCLARAGNGLRKGAVLEGVQRIMVHEVLEDGLGRQHVRGFREGVVQA
jgi:hypothetical protein